VSNVRTIHKQWIRKDLEGKCHGPIRFYPAIGLEVLRRATRNINQAIRCPAETHASQLLNTSALAWLVLWSHELTECYHYELESYGKPAWWLSLTIIMGHADVIGFFNLPNPSSRTMTLGSTQPLTEMSTRNLPGGRGRPASKDDKITANWEPRRLTTLRASTVSYRDSFTFFLTWRYIAEYKYSYCCSKKNGAPPMGV
jgi:hypothetical protein